MRAPYYSIVTVTKNNLVGLEATAHSITLQTTDQWRDYEWIVIDGHSDDGTEKFLKETNKNGMNVNWISEHDDGLYDAMNKGIERSNGVYIIFMNAGDTFAEDDILEKIQNDIDEPLPDLIYGDALEENEQGIQYYKHARSHRLIHKGLFTHHQAMLYRRDKISDLRFNLNYQYAADYDFTARFLKRNPYAHFLNQPICIFESGGMSQQNASKSRNEEFQIRKALKVPVYKNIAVTLRQLTAQIIRRINAPLYWKLHKYF